APVVLGALGEAEPGVEDDLVLGDALGEHRVDPFGELLTHLGDHVGVDGAAVHVVAVAAPVHHHVRHAGGGDHTGHLGVGQAAAHVVHQGRAGLDRDLGHLGAHRVHAHRDALGDEGADHRLDAADLLLQRHPGGAGAGGLTAHVDD